MDRWLGLHCSTPGGTIHIQYVVTLTGVLQNFVQPGGLGGGPPHWHGPPYCPKTLIPSFLSFL